jgi:hypothetical protein
MRESRLSKEKSFSVLWYTVNDLGKFRTDCPTHLKVVGDLNKSEFMLYVLEK